jgi:hypothetical protein
VLHKCNSKRAIQKEQITEQATVENILAGIQIVRRDRRSIAKAEAYTRYTEYYTTNHNEIY